MLDGDDLLNPDVIGPGVNVVAKDQENAIEVAGDEEHLVWRSADPNPFSQVSYVRGCMKNDCGSTMTTYESGTTIAVGSSATDSRTMAISDGDVYWAMEPGPGTFQSSSLLGCPIAGCVDSPRTVVSGVDIDAIAIDEKHFYWGSSDDTAVLRHPLADEPKVEAVALNVLVQHLVVRDKHVYWDELTGTSRVIRRAPKTGDGPPVTLIEDQGRGALAVDDQFVYWTIAQPDGAIFRCPLSGCEGAPTLLIAGQPTPTALVTDGKTMTWISAVETQRSGPFIRGSVLHCAVEACAETLQTWSTQNFARIRLSLAADSRNVYWAAQGSAVNPTPGIFFRGTIYRHAL